MDDYLQEEEPEKLKKQWLDRQLQWKKKQEQQKHAQEQAQQQAQEQAKKAEEIPQWRYEVQLLHIEDSKIECIQTSKIEQNAK